MDYQELFNHMYDEYSIVLVENEMDEIISIVKRMLNNSEATFETPSVNDNEAQKKSCQFYTTCKNPFKDDECLEVGMQDDCFE